MYLAEYNNLFTKNVRISFDQGFQTRLMQSAYNKLFAVADTTEIVEKFNSTESMDLPQYVSEGQTLPITKLYKGYLTTFQGKGFGHRILVTKEARLSAKDDTLVLAMLIAREKQKALDAFDRFIETEAHKFFQNAFINTPGFTGPDGIGLIGTHVWNSTGTTWTNLLVTQALNVDAVRQLEIAAGAFVDANGNVMPLRPDTVIVKKGSTASFQAKQLFGINMGQYSPTVLGNVNIFQGGSYTMIETPFFVNDPAIPSFVADTVYFFADSRMMANDNALFMHFLQRPRLEGEATQLPDLTYQYYFYGHFKAGIRALPIGWR
jgi:hypothetical protein